MGLIETLISRFDPENRQWRQLKPREREWVESNPYSAWKISQIASRAEKVASEQFPGKKLHNDESDAFRHCFWSASLVRSIGYEKAKAFTDLHESDPSFPVLEVQMDLHNNKVGLELGRSNRGPEDWLIRECRRALDQGRLKARP